MQQSLSLEELLVHLGSELQYRRHNNKLKIVSVGKAIGVSHGVISRIENGRYEALTLALLKKLCDYYDIPLSLLFINGDADNKSALLEYLQSEIIFLRESHRDLLKAYNSNTIVGDF